MFQNLPFQPLRARRIAWLAPLVLSACLAPSDLPPRQAAMQGETPHLLPLSAILGQVDDGPNTDRLTAAPDTRVAALQARAARLRGPVIAPDQRQRMQGSGARLR
ncbi:MAG: hypothetical protein ACNA7L_05435 [Roseinatronobacter sp.]